MDLLGNDSSAARVALPLSLAVALSLGIQISRAQPPAAPPVATGPAPAINPVVVPDATNAVATERAGRRDPERYPGGPFRGTARCPDRYHRAAR